MSGQGRQGAGDPIMGCTGRPSPAAPGPGNGNLAGPQTRKSSLGHCDEMAPHVGSTAGPFIKLN